MPDDVNKTLKISIELDKTGTGGTDAKTDIKALADETERYQARLKEMAEGDSDTAANKRFADLHTKAQAYAASVQDAAAKQKIFDDALKEFKTQAEQGGEGAGDMEKHAQSLRLVFGELGRTVPELGHILHSVFEGAVIGAVFTFAMEVKDAYEQINEFNKSLDELAANNAAPDFLDTIISRMAVLAQGAADAQAFADGQNKIADSYNNINTALQDQLKLYNDIERARAAQTSADKALEIAKLQAAEAAHAITPEQAAEQRAAIEKKYNLQKQQETEHAQNAELAKKQRALAAAQGQQGSLNAAAKAAMDRVKQTEANDTEVKIDPVKTMETIRALIANISREEELKNKQTKIGGGLSASEAGELFGLQMSDEDRRGRLAQKEEELRKYNATISPDALAQRQADKDAADLAKSKADENLKTITDLTHAIQELSRSIAITRPQQEKTTATENQTVDVQANTELIKNFETDARKLQQFARNRNPTAEMIANIQPIIQSVLAMLQDHTDILKVLPDYGAAIGNMQRDIAEVKSILENQRGQLNSS